MEYLGIKCRGGRGCPLGSCSLRRNDDCIPLWPLRPSLYPTRIDYVSRFESKPFRWNILESNAGGGGAPVPGTGWRGFSPSAAGALGQGNVGGLAERGLRRLHIG